MFRSRGQGDQAMSYFRWFIMTAVHCRTKSRHTCLEFLEFGIGMPPQTVGLKVAEAMKNLETGRLDLSECVNGDG